MLAVALDARPSSTGRHVLNRFNPLAVLGSGTAAAPSNTLVTCTGVTPRPTLHRLLVRPGQRRDPDDRRAMSNPGTGTIGGYIKIERQNNADGPCWTDVTPGDPELRHRRHQLRRACSCARSRRRTRSSGSSGCATTAEPRGGGCNYNTDATGAKDPTNWWPNVLFDTREGLLRDATIRIPSRHTRTPTRTQLPDARRRDVLRQHRRAATSRGGSDATRRRSTSPRAPATCRRSTAPASPSTSRIGGTTEMPPPQETGEYGWEDFVNPARRQRRAERHAPDRRGRQRERHLRGVRRRPNYNARAGVPTFTRFRRAPRARVHCAAQRAAARPDDRLTVLPSHARRPGSIPGSGRR